MSCSRRPVGGAIASHREAATADLLQIFVSCINTSSPRIGMKRLLLICLMSVLPLLAKAGNNIPKGEWIILVGGPSLKEWEQDKAQPHDHWWVNFVRAARLRTEQLRDGLGPDAQITWLVYKQEYVDRAAQEKQDLIGLIG